MKIFITPFLISMALSLSINTNIQTNPSNEKKSVASTINYQQLASGANHNLEIRNGTLWAWGNNSSGQLGDATTFNKSSPVQVGSDYTWVSISGGESHSIGLKSNGTLWSWGGNSDGQLGDGTTTNHHSPMQMGGDHNWIGISCGWTHNLGLKSNGTLWSWGNNYHGPLGDGTYIDRTTPVQIGSDIDWVSIIAAREYSLGLKSDGTLWAWGYNALGQLGDGTHVGDGSSVTSRTVPEKIGSDINWVSIAANGYHSLGLKVNGSLWAWGQNSQGELGDGTNTQRDAPVQIGTDRTWIRIAAGGTHTLGLKSDGTFWSWGRNHEGQLGDGTITVRYSPVQIGMNNTWENITAGNSHSLRLKSGGHELCATGQNNNGQLGDGTIIPKSSFTCNSNCNSSFNQCYYDLTSFMSIFTLSQPQLIDFSKNFDGTPITSPGAQTPYGQIWHWNDITFNNISSYWNSFIETNPPGQYITIDFPPGLYKKAGFAMSLFNGVDGNYTIKVTSGNCVYNYVQFRTASQSCYFGINLPTGIDKIEVMHNTGVLVVDDFRFGN